MVDGPNDDEEAAYVAVNVSSLSPSLTADVGGVNCIDDCGAASNGGESKSAFEPHLFCGPLLRMACTSPNPTFNLESTLFLFYFFHFNALGSSPDHLEWLAK